MIGDITSTRPDHLGIRTIHKGRRIVGTIIEPRPHETGYEVGVRVGDRIRYIDGTFPSFESALSHLIEVTP